MSVEDLPDSRLEDFAEDVLYALRPVLALHGWLSGERFHDPRRPGSVGMVAAGNVYDSLTEGAQWCERVMAVARR